MRKKRVATAVIATLFGSTMMAWAGSPSALKTTVSQWDAATKELTLTVANKSLPSKMTLSYGGKQYPLRASGGETYSLTLQPICYDSRIEIKSSDGRTLSTSVSVRNGSAKGQACSADAAAARDLVVLATTDLGMHCACPGTEYFMLLPPFSTIRAQVIARGKEPRVLGAKDGIVVEYNMVENTDDSLKNDPYYATWIKNMPKYGFGAAVRPDGKIQGISGATLAGQLEPRPEGWWEIVGVPAYPDATNSPAADRIMTDPLGGPNRNPYLTAEIKVKDATSGKLLTETKAVVPVAFGGCCNCHLRLTKDKGMEPTPANSFALMGQLHERDSGINFATIDPDGDGQPGPIRCSACHLDPAMGEAKAPGYPGYRTSQYTFSNVLHRWHAASEAVKKYDPDISRNCYACHPGNNVGCFRDFHAEKGMWCTDCHGDLTKRVAEGQVDKPWSSVTLPKCADCHQNTGEGGGFINVFGGEFLNSRGHVDQKILCSSCHGSPHALYPSRVAKDNYQPIALQGKASAIGRCDICHTDKGSQWAKPPHAAGNGAGGTVANPGGSTAIDAANMLRTTCLTCHGDNQSLVNCGNAKWQAHNGSRVSAAIFEAVSSYLTGTTCAATTTGGMTGTTASGGGTANSATTGGGNVTVDVATTLTTICVSCHGDNRSLVNCGNAKWQAHNGSRVSAAIFGAVSSSLTGGTCSTASGGITANIAITGGTSTAVDVATTLTTTCVSCHGDNQSLVNCGNAKWLAHNGSRVSAAIFSAVSSSLTGGTCTSAAGTAATSGAAAASGNTTTASPSGGNAAANGGGSPASTNAATLLTTTCVSCHGDNRSLVNCGNVKWQAHNGSRVSSTIYNAVSNYLTGGCSAPTGTVGGGAMAATDAATALSSTCLGCHGDNRSRVNCGNPNWQAHNGSRVSSAIYNAVSSYLTGATCAATSGANGGGGEDDGDQDHGPARERDKDREE